MTATISAADFSSEILAIFRTIWLWQRPLLAAPEQVALPTLRSPHPSQSVQAVVPRLLFSYTVPGHS